MQERDGRPSRRGQRHTAADALPYTRPMPLPGTPTLSQRGARLVANPPMAEYIGEHFARSGASWHPEDNPDGYVGMCIAENKLMGDVLLPVLTPDATPPRYVLGYDAMVGSHAFREQLSIFMAQTFLSRRVTPEQIVVLAGAGTVLEALFYTIANPGDGVLVPTPSYSGFWADLETRDGLGIVPVPCRSEDGFRLTPERLDAALGGAGRPVKAVLFTNPDNPLGRVAPAEDVAAILSWADGHGLHVVFDEIYALSVFGDTAFTSAAAVGPSLGERTHIVWGFSKDFGASGLRCGVLVSENEAVLAAVDGLAYWGAVSGHTQWLLQRAITDEAWVETYLGELRSRLGGAYRTIAAALEGAGITHVPAEAGIFVLCDLRAHLADPTWEAERALWRRILDEANVNLTPGNACRIAEPGFFRLCYAAEPTDAIVAGIGRLASVVERTP